jgi:hypothetical protein
MECVAQEEAVGGWLLSPMIDISAYKEAATRAWSVTQDLHLPSDDRTRLSAGLLQLAQEHHASIILLIEHQQCGSAFALLRPLYEAFVRGVWLGRIASENDVIRYRRDEKFNLRDQAGKVSELPPFDGTSFAATARSALKAMHSYTHNGYLASVRRLSSDAIEPAYEVAEIREVLEFAQLFGVLATAEILELATNVENVRVDELQALVQGITMRYPSDSDAV